MRATERFLSPALCVCAAGLLLGVLLWPGLGTAQQPAGQLPHVMVADVIVKGNNLISSQTIIGQMKTRANTEFQDDVLMDDVRTLMATRQYKNVEPRVLTDADGRVRIFMIVTELPTTVTKVTYTGLHHLSDDELEKITQIHKGMPLSTTANKVACTNIVHRLNEDGRLFASCTLLSGDKPGDTEVTFSITEGNKLKISDIEFVGNTFVNSSRLATQINSGKAFLGVIGGSYNPTLAAEDQGKLEKYYKDFGFFDVKVSRAVRYGLDGNTLVLVFYINEGVRYRYRTAPQIASASGKPLPQPLLELEPLVVDAKEGEYFRQADVTKDTARIKNYIGWEGYKVDVTAKEFYVPEPGVVQVVYQVQEEQPSRVGRIIIQGNSRTDQRVIIRELQIYPGQTLPYPELEEAVKRLQRLNIFKNSPDEKPTITIINPDFNNPNADFKDILVTVTEDNTGSLLFGVGVNSDSGLTGSIVLNERNFDITRVPTSWEDLISGGAFRGAGQELRLEAVPGTEVQRYSATWREPALFDSKFSLAVSGYYYEREYNEYTEERLGAKVTLARKLNKYWSVSAAVRVEHVNIGNLVDGEPSEITNYGGGSFLAGLRVGATRDARDNFLRPTEGNIISGSVEQVTGTYNYTLANLEASQFFTIFQRADGSGRQVLALHSQASWASDTTPVYERFYAGGFQSMRGFEFRGVGPQDNGYKTGGDFMFLNSAEYQIPVMANDNFYFVGFIDTGTVESRISLAEYRVAAGVGVRFVVPMLGPVPIALDFGFPIVKTSFDNTQVFSFWVGFTR